MYELFWWFWVAYTLKLLKTSGASLGFKLFYKSGFGFGFGFEDWAGFGFGFGFEHRWICPSLIHNLFLGTPLFWGSGYQTRLFIWEPRGVVQIFTIVF